jgi:hypothetical protein
MKVAITRAGEQDRSALTPKGFASTLTLAALLPLTLGGCIIDKDSYAGAYNATDRRLVVVGTADGSNERLRIRVDPRSATAVFGGEGCRHVTVEVRYPQGASLGGYSGQLCSEQNLYITEGGIELRGWGDT